MAPIFCIQLLGGGVLCFLFLLYEIYVTEELTWGSPVTLFAIAALAFIAFVFRRKCKLL